MNLVLKLAKLWEKSLLKTCKNWETWFLFKKTSTSIKRSFSPDAILLIDQTSLWLEKNISSYLRSSVRPLDVKSLDHAPHQSKVACVIWMKARTKSFCPAKMRSSRSLTFVTRRLIWVSLKSDWPFSSFRSIETFWCYLLQTIKRFLTELRALQIAYISLVFLVNFLVIDCCSSRSFFIVFYLF